LSATALTTEASAPSLLGRGSFTSLARYWHFAALGLVLFLAFLANRPTLNDYFHGDDYLAFIDLASTPTWKHLEEVVLFKDSNVYWRPLGEVYYLALYETFGLDEVAFHLANLAFFLATIVLLYVFCVRAGLGRWIGLGAGAVLAVFPNHVVSVAWVTNGPRLVAVFFALLGLVMLQQAIAKRSMRWEVLSFLAFVLGGLADETALVLAPLPLVYSFYFDRERPAWLKRTLLRSAPYLALAAALTPVQFLGTEKDPGFSRLAIGWHIPEHFWALASKLVWPSTNSNSFAGIESEQWIVGAAALVLVGLALVAGSNRMRFLALWLVLALLPFSTWTWPIVPPRYIYMAAVPFAVILAWVGVSLAEAFVRARPFATVLRLYPAVGYAAAAAALGAGILLADAGIQTVHQRDRTFANDAETYRVLAYGLMESAPKVPKGAKIIIYYGIWNGLSQWPDAVAKTIYKDESVRIVNVPPGQVELGHVGRGPTDVVLFYTGDGFIKSAPLKASGN
jgi:hypothetical protein